MVDLTAPEHPYHASLVLDGKTSSVKLRALDEHGEIEPDIPDDPAFDFCQGNPVSEGAVLEAKRSALETEARHAARTSDERQLERITPQTPFGPQLRDHLDGQPVFNGE